MNDELVNRFLCRDEDAIAELLRGLRSRRYIVIDDMEIRPIPLVEDERSFRARGY